MLGIFGGMYDEGKTELELSRLETHMKLQKLNKEIVDSFVVEIVVHDREMIDIKWKFRDELLF